MCLDGDGQFQLMGLGSSAKMRTLGSPKFSSQFEHVGGSRLGHFAAGIKGSPAPCKSRLQMKWGTYKC